MGEEPRWQTPRSTRIRGSGPRSSSAADSLSEPAPLGVHLRVLRDTAITRMAGSQPGRTQCVGGREEVPARGGGVGLAHRKGWISARRAGGVGGQAFSGRPTGDPQPPRRPSEQARSPCVPTSTMGTSLVLRKLQRRRK